MKIRTWLAIIFTYFLLFPNVSLAEGNDKFITIVNPVRISKYNNAPGESLRAQYDEVKKNNLPATWLFTFDALENREIFSVVRDMDKAQEYGIYLEVTKNFTEKVGIKYRDTGHWHHAGSVFLSGYTREERVILIDKVFETFKVKFGYYPKSVGSWWTDSFSLNYMLEKYGIKANLICADQFAMDNYQLWGQNWIEPYYPSKTHAGVPAQDSDNKLDVVNIQWAGRDPLNGYESSLYSTQDYVLLPISEGTKYFERLIDIYLEVTEKKNFGFINVGLEADLSPSGYTGEFARQMEVVNKKEGEGVGVVSMSEFSDIYREKFPETSFSFFLENDDLLGTETKSYWYQSNKYRLSYVKTDKNLIIRDLRIYPNDLAEPYFVAPNRDTILSINIPSLFDQMGDVGNVWELPLETEIVAETNRILILGKNVSIPRNFDEYSSYVSITKVDNGIEISFADEMNVPKEGVEYKGLSLEAIHFFKEIKSILSLFIGRGWNHFQKVTYLIPQEEIYALKHLSTLPPGKVLVYDTECLQCSYHGEYRPPAFSNLRKYVRDYSKHKIVKNQDIFETESREESKRKFERSGAKYIYLVKHEDYFEEIPFSPGDLGVEMIFSNANAEIWRVKEK